MPNSENGITAQQMTWWLQLRKNATLGALTFFVHKIARESTGESFGSDTLSDWCMQKNFGRLDWFHASNLDQRFSFVSFQTASCLQLL